MNNFKIVPASQIRIKYKVSDSIFWGHIKNVISKEEAELFIGKIKKEYHDATHNVSAYMISNKNDNIEYYDDDGEPSNSSGPPVLEKIKGFNLIDTVVVVTRYFGGTKLGIGGLIRAYGDTAEKVIKKAGTKKLKLYYYVKAEGSYNNIGNILGQIEAFKGNIKDTVYNENGIIVFFYLNPQLFDKLKNKLIELTGNKLDIEIKNKIYL